MTKPFKNQITALILAGGESSRMGEDKALLQLDGKTLLNHVCAIAMKCTTQTYVVTPWNAKYQDIVPPGCQLIPEQLVSNAPSNTPLIGFTQGLQSVKTEWVLLLACDLPYLSSSQVKQWSGTLATVLPTEIALVPRTGTRWEPLCGFYRRSCLDSLTVYLKQGGTSFQGWLNRSSVKELTLCDRRCLFNCNTPEDWQLFRTERLRESQ